MNNIRIWQIVYEIITRGIELISKNQKICKEVDLIYKMRFLLTFRAFFENVISD
jgi:hypothetical protein